MGVAGAWGPELDIWVDGGHTWSQGEWSRKQVLRKAVVQNEVPALPGHAGS